MLLANSTATKEIYHSILETELSIGISNENFSISIPKGMTVERFVNDLLAWSRRCHSGFGERSWPVAVSQSADCAGNAKKEYFFCGHIFKSSLH
jgi:hypothetical protein